MNKKITIIEPVDMSKPMFGNGIATVVASAIRVMGDRLILIGLTSDEKIHPVGHWCQTTLFGKTCEFFPVMTANELNGKYIKNLSFTLRLMRLWPALLTKTSDVVMSQNYMVMWWLGNTRCFLFRVFYFPGLANPVLVGRKPVLGKLLYRLYESINLLYLEKMEIIFAAASKNEIDRSILKWKRKLHIYQLPTSVDTDLFTPQKNLKLLKQKYNLQEKTTYFVCVGRLAKVKGIDFLIDSLQVFHKQFGAATLLLIGEGEERAALEKYVHAKKLEQFVQFFGNRLPEEVGDIVNCADLCIIGSTFEGFSCAMVEQIACGKPLVSTDVSGASEIIEEGINGFIVKKRDPAEFALAMNNALNLQGAGKRSREIALSKYSENVVWNKFIKLMEGSLEKVISQG